MSYSDDFSSHTDNPGEHSGLIHYTSRRMKNSLPVTSEPQKQDWCGKHEFYDVKYEAPLLSDDGSCYWPAETGHLSSAAQIQTVVVCALLTGPQALSTRGRSAGAPHSSTLEHWWLSGSHVHSNQIQIHVTPILLLVQNSILKDWIFPGNSGRTNNPETPLLTNWQR